MRRYSELVSLIRPKASDSGPDERVTGEYAEMSVDALLALVPSLGLARFSCGYRDQYFVEKDFWEIAWEFKGCSNTIRHKDLHTALLRTFEHLQLERVRLT